MMALTLITAVVFLLIFAFIRKPRHSNYQPGPLNLPLVGYLPFLTKYPHRKLAQLSKKYGEIYSIQMGDYRAVVLSSLKSMKLALKEEATTGRPRIPLYVARSEGKGLIFSDGLIWSETRKFTLNKLKDFGFGTISLEEIIKNDIVEFLAMIKSNEGKPVDLRNTINLAIINALWTIVAGQRFCDQNDFKGLQTIRDLAIVVRDLLVGNLLEFLPWLPQVGHLRKLRQHTLENIQKMKDVMQKSVDEHLKDHFHGQDSDFIHVFLNAVQESKDPGSPFYGEEGVRNLVILLTDLFGAGSETTSTWMLWAILLMATYPEIQSKAQTEIDRVVPGHQLPSMEHRSLLPYTEAVVHEVRRFTSFGPLGVIHRTLKDTKLMDYDIPSDTLLITDLYQVLSNPQHWEKPNEFYPEHFLDSSGKFVTREEFVLFGVGKRRCPGESLARMELFLFLSSLLQQFEFKFPAEEPRPSLKPIPGLVCPPEPFHIIAKSRGK